MGENSSEKFKLKDLFAPVNPGPVPIITPKVAVGLAVEKAVETVKVAVDVTTAIVKAKKK